MGESDVFLRAAQWIDVGDRHWRGVCVAVSMADRGDEWYERSKAVADFQKRFKPLVRFSFSFWMDDGSLNLKRCRVIALLLAHAMRQTGDL